MDSMFHRISVADFQKFSDLARVIWHQSFSAIVSEAQIEYMLARRLSVASLAAYVDSDTRWLDLLWVDGALAGYCSYALADQPQQFKLEQLFLLGAYQGLGLGRKMFERIHAQAVACGRSEIVLLVNKSNAGPIAIYQHWGFEISAAETFDIGNGFFMDDYIMKKPVQITG